MSLCNGELSDKSFKRRRRKSIAEDHDTDIERIFRGFQKSPFVLLPRMDITPYLKGKNDVKSIPKVTSTCMTLDKHLSKLTGKCVVELDKLDLDALKDTASSRSSSPSSGDTSMSNFKCKICEKAYSSERKLQNHEQNKHMIVYKPETSKTQKRVSFSDHVIVHEMKEYHKCRKCTKIFENYKTLKLHMKSKHKKRKCYICDYCLKRFVDRMFFKVHIKLHCDVCRELFPTRTLYLQHRRDFCRTFKLHKCKTCNESFFRIMDLKDHSYEHIGTFFICDICKEQCTTKCGISHHIAFLHSKDRPTTLYDMRNIGSEKVYLCNFCDTSSVERKQLEEHVKMLPDLMNRAMTGYKDFYFCDQCLKKFDTETDMLNHKWTHFLKGSNILREKLESKKNNIRKLYNANEKIPEYLLPSVVLEKINIGGKVLTEQIDYVNIQCFDIRNGVLKKAVVDPVSKKTIISNHQCQNCLKYFSSGYCLRRHIQTLHRDFDKLQCKVCEETFVWASLLETHKCIRLNLPEMPFDDMRPEIHFENAIYQNNFDDLNIDESENYDVDFEIPAPICQLTEYDNVIETGKYGSGMRIVMQEVPIEF